MLSVIVTREIDRPHTGLDSKVQYFIYSLYILVVRRMENDDEGPEKTQRASDASEVTKFFPEKEGSEDGSACTLSGGPQRS